MKIAILGWGSLIWNPINLQIDTNQENNGWLTNGPMLPIEFARISRDGRLTLVIVPNEVNKIQVFYAFSKFLNLDEAILDLAVREGCGKNKIGYYDKKKKKISDNFTADKFKNQRSEIENWTNDQDVDAVIWTNLSSNFKDKLGLNDFKPMDAINYLKYLSPDVKARAEEYIRKAPKVVDTPIRKEIELKLKWMPIGTL
ncbi:MAG TPA: hypothetical protein VIL78_02145 [Hanamia sp.]